MATLDYDVIKEIPGYKVIMKSVLKSLIQQLVEQLASHTEEESVILTANVSDGTLSHLGSDSGKSFLDDHEDIKSQFLGFCLKRHHRKKQEKEREEQEEAMRAAASQYAMRAAQTGPRFMARSPRMQSPRQSIHPVSLPRMSPGSRGQRHEPYTVNRPRRPSETQSAPSPSGTMQLPVVGNAVVKTEPTDESDNNRNGDTGNTQTPSQNQEDDVHSNLSSNLNESQDIKPNETLPSSELGQDSDQSGDVDNADTSEPNIKLETLADSEMDLEITGVEPGRPVAPQENWGPSTSAGFDQSGATGSPGDIQGFSFQNKRTRELQHKTNLILAETEKSMTDEEPMSGNSEGVPDELFALFPKEEVDTEKIGRPACGECGKTFSTKSSLTRHRKTHLPNTIRCSACHQYFKTEKEKITHVQEKHTYNICHICGKNFKRPSDLNIHLKVHGNDTAAKFKCPFDGCVKTFVKRTVFQDHLNTHTGQKPYKCKSCPASFKSRYEGNSHNKHCAGLTHKIRCKTCQKTFNHRDSLHHHIAANHSGQIFRCGCGASYKYRLGLLRHKKSKGHQ